MREAGSGAAIAEAKPQSILVQDLHGRDPHHVRDPILWLHVDRLRSAADYAADPATPNRKTGQISSNVSYIETTGSPGRCANLEAVLDGPSGGADGASGA